MVQSTLAQQAVYIPAFVDNNAQRDPYALVTATSSLGTPTFSGSPNWILGGNSGQFTNAALFGNKRLLPVGAAGVGSRMWLSAEWLLWQSDGMDVPALVTTSPAGTPQNEAAFLGGTGTSVLFGNGELNDGTANGFRVNLGFWATPQQSFAVEGEYFRLAEQSERYNASSDGTTILGRPFFDIVAGQETAQLFSYPGLVAGSLNIDAETNLQSALVNVRASLCPQHGLCDCRRDRIDWIVGYRYLELSDDLRFTENLTSLSTAAPGTIALNDRFDTSNKFNGLQLGLIHRASFRRGFLESMLRVALGNNDQTVHISGNTSITEAGLTDNFTGGLLAQRTNIGRYQRDEFMMVPEIGFKLGFRLTERLSATAGYTALYFPNVVRAGNQIDTDLNPNLVAPEVVPFSGALRPRFRFVESDHWTHGLTVGGELNF